MHGRLALAALLLGSARGACPVGQSPVVTCVAAVSLGFPIIVTAVPPIGTILGLVGSAPGAPGGSRAALYLSCSSGVWGPKPALLSAVPVGAGGSFVFTGWASPGTLDATCPGMTVIILAAGAAAPASLGLAAAPAVGGAVLASTLVSRACAAPGQQLLPTAACAPTPPTPAGAVVITAVAPPLGSTAAIAGVVTGAPPGSALAVYVLCGGAVWGPKPGLGFASPIDASGAFTVQSWASPNTQDAACAALILVVLPSGGAGPPPALGTVAAPPGIASLTVTRPPAPPGLVVPPLPAPPALPAPPPPPPPPAAAELTLTYSVPPLGSAQPITGRAAGAVPAGATIGILVSSLGGIWWDKTHDYPSGVPIAVNLGIPIAEDGTFTILGWVSDPNDLTAGTLRVVLMAPGFSWKWPGYQVEGSLWPNYYFSASAMLACTQANRASGALSDCGWGAVGAAAAGGGGGGGGGSAAGSAADGALASPAAAGIAVGVAAAAVGAVLAAVALRRRSRASAAADTDAAGAPSTPLPDSAAAAASAAAELRTPSAAELPPLEQQWQQQRKVDFSPARRRVTP